MEEVWEEEKGGALIEALRGEVSAEIMEESLYKTYVAIMVDETASPSREVVLFNYGDLEPGFCKASSCRYASYSGAYSIDQ